MLKLVHEVRRVSRGVWKYRGCVIKRQWWSRPRPVSDEFVWHRQNGESGFSNTINGCMSQIDERMDDELDF